MQRDDALEFFGKMRTPSRLTFRKRHFLEILRMRQMVDARHHQRREHLAVGDHAADRDAAEADAGITLFPPDESRARGFATQTLIGDRHLDRRVDRLGTR